MFLSFLFIECGYPEQLVLTNEHLIALTDKGLYISSSMIRSDKNIEADFDEKPLLSYELRDPCEKFDRFISCFKVNFIKTMSQWFCRHIMLYF